MSVSEYVYVVMCVYVVVRACVCVCVCCRVCVCGSQRPTEFRPLPSTLCEAGSLLFSTVGDRLAGL